MRRTPSPPRPDWQRKVEALGFDFHTQDGRPYWSEEVCYSFSASEIDKLEGVSEELHRLCLQAVERVVREGLYQRLAIPPLFIPYIEKTWRRGDPELVGRFDLAYDGVHEPKLLEYNADTPTSLLETAVIQWYWLQEINSAADQFNSIHEKLVGTWKDIAARLFPGSLVHFASLTDDPEDFANSEYLRDTCRQAGLETCFIDIQKIGWNGCRFTDLDERPIQLMAKLYPWEWLIRDEFAPHIITDTTAFLEPAWKMVLSNKGILPILWEMFPGHPNLLPAYEISTPLEGRWVRKPLFGREGANITITAPEYQLSTLGSYGKEGYIYQEHHPLAVFNGWSVVIGSWIIGGRSAGIGLREDRNPITSNVSRFVPHMIR